MIYNWYKIFNLTEFEALDLVSKNYHLDLEDLGEKDFLVTKGDAISILYDGVFLSINLNGKNPFSFEGYAVYLKESTQDVYFGFEAS